MALAASANIVPIERLGKLLLMLAAVRMVVALAAIVTELLGRILAVSET